MIKNSSLFSGDKTAPFSGRILLLIFFLILSSLALSLYKESLFFLSAAVLGRQGSSHGIFVPFISSYFLWLNIHKIKEITPRYALPQAGLMLIIGISLFIYGNLWGFQLSILSFLLIAAALILILFGKEIFMETSFPLFFLATMIPLPTDAYLQIAEWMRAINTWASVSVTKAFGVPVYREGYDVYLPGLHLVVNHSCSGIRYLLSFFTFSIVYAALARECKWARLSVVMGSIPLSIFAGTIRLSVVFLAAHYIDPYWAGHKPHVFLSWVVFAVFLFGCIGLDQFFLRRQSAD